MLRKRCAKSRALADSADPSWALGADAEDKSECWTSVFSEPQLNQPNNPNGAKFHADWVAAAAAYPGVARAGTKVKEGLANVNYQVTPQWTPNHPYVRICVPVSPSTACNQLALWAPWWGGR